MKKMFVVLMVCIAMLSMSFTACTTGKSIDSGYPGTPETIYDVLETTEEMPLIINFVSPYELVSTEEANMYLQQTSRLQSMFGLGDSNIVYDTMPDDATMRSGFIIGGPEQNLWAAELGVQLGELQVPSENTAIVQLVASSDSTSTVWLVFVAGAGFDETRCAIDLLTDYWNHIYDLSKSKAIVTCESEGCSTCMFGVLPPVIPEYTLMRSMSETTLGPVIGELTNPLQIQLTDIEGSLAGIYLTESVSGAVVDSTTVNPSPIAVSSDKIEWLLIDPVLLEDPMMAAMFSDFPLIQEGQELAYSVIPSANIVYINGIAQSSVASDIECSSESDCLSEYPSCVEGLCVLELEDKYVEGIGSFSAVEPVSDEDQDSIPDENDNCPNTANTDQADTDADGLGNVCDACPNDADNDIDGDSVCGDVDNCGSAPNQDQADCDSDGIGNACDIDSSCSTDSDGDNVMDSMDNCINSANPSQADCDSDGIGNACDSDSPCSVDSDGDSIMDSNDNCAEVANSGQADSDADGLGDVCDACPNDADNDIDRDGVCSDIDSCPGIPNIGDTDNDGIDDACDSSIARSVISIINEKRDPKGQISIVYGANADPFETVSVGQIIPIGLLNKGSGAILDSQLADYGLPDLIVVGGPCANMVAKSLLGSPEVCYDGWVAGTALIQVFLNELTGSEQVLVAGAQKEDTYAAAKFLRKFDTNQAVLSKSKLWLDTSVDPPVEMPVVLT